MHIATLIMRSHKHRVDSNNAIKMRFINGNGRQTRVKEEKKQLLLTRILLMRDCTCIVNDTYVYMMLHHAMLNFNNRLYEQILPQLKLSIY